MRRAWSAQTKSEKSARYPTSTVGPASRSKSLGAVADRVESRRPGGRPSVADSRTLTSGRPEASDRWESKRNEPVSDSYIGGPDPRSRTVTDVVFGTSTDSRRRTLLVGEHASRSQLKEQTMRRHARHAESVTASWTSPPERAKPTPGSTDGHHGTVRSVTSRRRSPAVARVTVSGVHGRVPAVRYR